MNIDTINQGMLISDYNYIFVPMTKITSHRCWEVRDKDKNLLGDLHEDLIANKTRFSPNLDKLDDTAILIEFDIFQSACPAYFVHPVHTLDAMEEIPMKQKYLLLLFGALLSRNIYKSSKIERKDELKLYDRFIKMKFWLENTDFFNAPASSKYHDSEKSGLLQHTLNVVNKLGELYTVSSFELYSNSYTFASALLVSLVHDWCKIGYYESYIRNVKNDQTGQWEQVEAYRIKETTNTCLGHGVSSMFLANKFFNLTTAEAEAIRWHMGEYNIAPNEMNELHQANAQNPLCYLIQFADRLACTNY